jgi:hypothetical protein
LGLLFRQPPAVKCSLQQTYKNKFDLIDFVNEVYIDVGILVNVKRISDKKVFTLPLADLVTTTKKSKNYKVLDDYSVWFVNYH